MKIFIAVDSEGGSGIIEYWARNLEPANPLFQENRALMTGDANAAVEGCLAGGAAEVIVSDDDFGGVNMIPEMYHPDAKWIRGRGCGSRWGLSLLHGLDETFDGVVLVGFHAMQGAPGGVLAHTFSSATRRRYWINGRESGELAMYALTAGHFGVPAIAVTGCEALCREAGGLLGDELVTVPVKKGFTELRALMIAPSKARDMIRQGVKQAVEKIHTGRFKPLRTKLPLHVRLQFPTKELADGHEAQRRQHDANWPGRRADETAFEGILESPLELGWF